MLLGDRGCSLHRDGRYCLSKASPLLADIVGLEEGDTVALEASPQDMQLPSDTFHLRLEPLKYSPLGFAPVQNLPEMQ